MADTKRLKSLMLGPIFENNPIALQILGVCSALAVTTKLETAVVMAISVALVTGFSSLFISMTALCDQLIFVINTTEEDQAGHVASMGRTGRGSGRPQRASGLHGLAGTEHLPRQRRSDP